MPPSVPGKRMTANPVRPARYRPGKAVQEQQSDSDREDEDDIDDTEEATASAPPPPATSSRPSDASRIASNLKNVDLNERRRQAEAQERVRQAKERAERERLEAEAGFVTASEDGSDGESGNEREAVKPSHAARATNGPHTAVASDSDEDEDSDSQTSDSSDSDVPKLLRPVFVRKADRTIVPVLGTSDEASRAADAVRRQATTDALLQEKLERDAAARAAGRKDWDDDEPGADELVDDTDGLDEALERAQWEARELARLQRGRAALEARETELAELERRRALRPEERAEEDARHVEMQKLEKDAKGKMNELQRYHHKGAFYQDEAKEQGLLDRDLMGARYADQRRATEALPEYLRVRDVTKIGRKSRTRYKDLKSEDTGRWGEFGARVGKGGKGPGLGDVDDRFKPDDDRGSRPTGANAGAVGDRKRPYGFGDAGTDDIKRARY